MCVCVCFKSRSVKTKPQDARLKNTCISSEYNIFTVVLSVQNLFNRFLTIGFFVPDAVVKSNLCLAAPSVFVQSCPIHMFSYILTRIRRVFKL